MDGDGEKYDAGCYSIIVGLECAGDVSPDVGGRGRFLSGQRRVEDPMEQR